MIHNSISVVVVTQKIVWGGFSKFGLHSLKIFVENCDRHEIQTDGHDLWHQQNIYFRRCIFCKFGISMKPLKDKKDVQQLVPNSQYSWRVGMEYVWCYIINIFCTELEKNNIRWNELCWLTCWMCQDFDCSECMSCYIKDSGRRYAKQIHWYLAKDQKS